VDFTFSDEQQELRATVRRFAEQVVAPVSPQIDREQHIPEQVMKGLRPKTAAWAHRPSTWGSQ